MERCARSDRLRDASWLDTPMATTSPPAAVASLLLRAQPRDRGRQLADLVATALVIISAVVGVLVLVAILAYVAIKGLPALDFAFFTERPLPPGEIGGGVAPAMWARC